MIKMIFDEEQGGYIPEECCTFTNPVTTQSGESEIDDVDIPGCTNERCEEDCSKCVIEKIFTDMMETIFKDSKAEEICCCKNYLNCGVGCDGCCEVCDKQKMFNDYAEKTGQAE